MAIRGRSGWLAALALAGTLAPAHADTCGDASTPTGLDRCASDVYAKADATLNATFKIVMDRLADQEEARKLFVAAEKAWIGFRDRECDFETASSIGGSVHPMVVTQCRTELTKTRTQALHRLLSCSEGDLACPIPPR